MRILSLNCQKGYRSEIVTFFATVCAEETYNFLLLQECTEDLIETLQPVLGKYSLVTASHPETHKQSLLVIVYKSTWRLLVHELIPMPNLHPRIIQPETFGILTAVFEKDDAHIRVGSTHLHPGFRSSVRRAGMQYIKSALLLPADVPTIFGGDCNFGLFGERKNARRILAPEFVPVSYWLPPTLDSRYSEPHPNIINSTAVWLAKYGISVKLHTDNFFVSRTLTETAKITCDVLPDRVSDHLPITLSLK